MDNDKKVESAVIPPDSAGAEQSSDCAAQEVQTEADTQPDGSIPVSPEEFERFLIEGAKAIAERDELQDKYTRIAAEYDNYRKRTAKERETIYADAQADTISKLLPVYDNLERAMLQPTEDAAFKKGVEMIMRQLAEVFDKLGVAEMELVGAQFDPNLHEAIAHVDDDTKGDNEIVEALQKGFVIGDRVIRHAMVKVAN